MKRRGYFSAALVLFLVLSYAVWYFLIKKENMCHIDSDTGVRTTIRVRWFEKSEHLGHGDYLGTCEEARTYVPDDGFERHLIYYGYDDVMDDYVLTSNINTITSFETEEGDNGPMELWNGVSDFTGIEDFVALTNLRIKGNCSSLDLSQNTNLTHLYLGLGAGPGGLILLTSLDLTQNIRLTNLSISKSRITSLDLENNRLITSLTLRRNGDLVNVNVKNGNNTSLDFNVDENLSLACVQVDDIAWSTANWTRFDPSIFSLDCGF